MRPDPTPLPEASVPEPCIQIVEGDITRQRVVLVRFGQEALRVHEDARRDAGL